MDVGYMKNISSDAGLSGCSEVNNKFQMMKNKEQINDERNESVLHGLLRKYGSSLRFADKVIASFQTNAVFEDRIEGMLFSHDACVPLVFEKNWVRGNVDALPSPGERATLRVTARPWIDGLGQVSLKAKHFMILPMRPDADARLSSRVGDRNIQR